MRRARGRKPAKRRDLYAEVTGKILALLESGTVPWRRPIKPSAGGDGLPRNLTSGKTYRGVNVFLLAATAWAAGYDSPFWLTYRQAQARGGNVRKGEKGSLVVFWKLFEKDDGKTDEPTRIPVLRHYTVFNAAAQCADVRLPEADDVDAEPFVPIEQAERIAGGYRDGPQVETAGRVACYRPLTDTVRMPDPRAFEDRERYYATLFHELAHSTGHSSRLDRGLDTPLAPFGSPDYGREELVAEMGAAFLAAAAGISPPTVEQSAAYVDGWTKKIRGDKKLVVATAAAGQKAADRILGTTWEPDS